MFCRICGKKIPDKVKKCSSCGAAVSEKTINLLNDRKKVENNKYYISDNCETQESSDDNNLSTRIAEKNNKDVKKSIMICMAIIIALLIIIIIALLFKENKDDVLNNKKSDNLYVDNNINEDKKNRSDTKKKEKIENENIYETESESEVKNESGNLDYVIPDSDTRLITEDDLKNLTQEQVRIARNEIYARHGRKFQDQELQTYFNSLSWYNGTIEPNDFDDNLLNEIELKNKDTIVLYEQKMGYK